jgi:hypothetical protein
MTTRHASLDQSLRRIKLGIARQYSHFHGVSPKSLLTGNVGSPNGVVLNVVLALMLSHQNGCRSPSAGILAADGVIGKHQRIVDSSKAKRAQALENC